MATVENGELQVVVPVGFLLAEPQEVTVSVDRPDGTALPVRLRLLPARGGPEATGTATLIEVADERPCVSTPTPMPITWSRRSRPVDHFEPEYGGGD